MSQELKAQLAEIKPGHPIWDEVWAKSRPGGTSHLNQIFEAKLKITQLERTNAALLGALKDMAEKFPILLTAVGNSPDVVAANIYVKNARAAIVEAETTGGKQC